MDEISTRYTPEQWVNHYQNNYVGTMTLDTATRIIKNDMTNMAQSCVSIGFHLKAVRDRELFREAGYESLWEYASDQFGLSISRASRYISINDQFSVGGNTPQLQEKYRNYSKSQLQEMITMSDEQRQQVTEGMTVKEIRQIKNPEPGNQTEAAEEGQIPRQMEIGDYLGLLPEESVAMSQQQATESNQNQITCLPRILECPRQEGGTSPEQRLLSVYGLPIRTYPPDSLIATPGCGTLKTGGVHDCFSCHMDGCKIRQEECYCVEAPMGKPFSCTTLNVVDNLREDVGGSCQFVDHNLAFHRGGDGEPVPCCKNCKTPCGYECRRSVNQRLGQKVAIGEKPESEIIDSDFRDAEACCERTDGYLAVPKSILEEEKKKLDEYLEAFKDEEPENIPPIVEKQKIIVAALAGMVCDLESAVPELEQPALPFMKNNEQRKEWLRNYKDWGLWYEDEHIGCRYYRYVFENGATLIAEEYDSQYSDYVSYFHLFVGPHCQHNKYGQVKYQMYDRYNKYPNSESELVEFLKEIQKGGK